MQRIYNENLQFVILFFWSVISSKIEEKNGMEGLYSIVSISSELEFILN